jgi:hypothetical protein
MQYDAAASTRLGLGCADSNVCRLLAITSSIRIGNATIAAAIGIAVTIPASMGAIVAREIIEVVVL